MVKARPTTAVSTVYSRQAPSRRPASARHAPKIARKATGRRRHGWPGGARLPRPDSLLELRAGSRAVTFASGVGNQNSGGSAAAPLSPDLGVALAQDDGQALYPADIFSTSVQLDAPSLCRVPLPVPQDLPWPNVYVPALPTVTITSDSSSKSSDDISFIH
jgi:hypothetical protein